MNSNGRSQISPKRTSNYIHNESHSENRPSGPNLEATIHPIQSPRDSKCQSQISPEGSKVEETFQLSKSQKDSNQFSNKKNLEIIPPGEKSQNDYKIYYSDKVILERENQSKNPASDASDTPVYVEVEANSNIKLVHSKNDSNKVTKMTKLKAIFENEGPKRNNMSDTDKKCDNDGQKVAKFATGWSRNANILKHKIKMSPLNDQKYRQRRIKSPKSQHKNTPENKKIKSVVDEHKIHKKESKIRKIIDYFEPTSTSNKNTDRDSNQSASFATELSRSDLGTVRNAFDKGDTKKRNAFDVLMVSGGTQPKTPGSKRKKRIGKFSTKNPFDRENGR